MTMLKIINQTPGTITTNERGEIIDREAATVTVSVPNTPAGFGLLKQFQSQTFEVRRNRDGELIYEVGRKTFSQRLEERIRQSRRKS